MWDWTDWAIAFFIVAIVAAMFGFTTIKGEAANIPKVLFYASLALAAISFILGRKSSVNARADIEHYKGRVQRRIK